MTALSILRPVLVVLALLVGVGARAAVPGPLGMMGATECSAAGEDAAGDLDDVDTVVPCALAEGGLLGASCFDARVYVVTPTGVVLCTMSLARQLSQASPPIVVADATLPPATTSHMIAVALAPEAPQAPLSGLVSDVVRALPHVHGPPPSPTTRPPLSPS